MTGATSGDELATVRSDATAPIFDVALPAQPYPGLRPFEKDEWPIFFGREVTTGDVVWRLIDKQFLALHGDSGCGKSSLVRAGVMPRLERDHARGGASWRTTSLLPRNAPLRNLATALAALEGTPPNPDRIMELRRVLNLGSQAAPHLSAFLRRGDNDYICILIDQFEEIFQLADQGGSGEVQQFVDVLTGLKKARAPGLHVVLTMRSEFLGRCANFDGLAEAINDTQFLLPRMDAQALMRAIREPARLYGGNVDRALAEAMVSDAGRGQDQLPLMQHAIMLLQRRAFGSTPQADLTGSWSIGLDAYRASGGMAKLLSEHADFVTAEIVAQASKTSEAKTAARLILEQTFKALTDINAEGHAIRRPQTIAQLMAVTGADRDALLSVIEPFCIDGVSFLKIFGRRPYGEGELVDIGHEALIRNWAKLSEWTISEAEAGSVYLRLLALTEERRANSTLLLGLREARDRERWWQEVAPSQAWANRYSHRHPGISVEEVRSLIDRSLDAELQTFSFWHEQLQLARAVWKREGRQQDRLLAGRALDDAERWLRVRDNAFTDDDREFINASLDWRRHAEDKEQQQRSAHERRRLLMRAAWAAAFAAGALATFYVPTGISVDHEPFMTVSGPTAPRNWTFDRNATRVAAIVEEDGKLLAKVWQLAPRPSTAPVLTTPATAAVLSPDGQSIAVIADGQLHLLPTNGPAANVTPIADLRVSSEGATGQLPITHVHFSSDSKWLITPTTSTWELVVFDTSNSENRMPIAKLEQVQLSAGPLMIAAAQSRPEFLVCSPGMVSVINMEQRPIVRRQSIEFEDPYYCDYAAGEKLAVVPTDHNLLMFSVVEAGSAEITAVSFPEGRARPTDENVDRRLPVSYVFDKSGSVVFGRSANRPMALASLIRPGAISAASFISRSRNRISEPYLWASDSGRWFAGTTEDGALFVWGTDPLNTNGTGAPREVLKPGMWSGIPLFAARTKSDSALLSNGRGVLQHVDLGKPQIEPSTVGRLGGTNHRLAPLHDDSGWQAVSTAEVQLIDAGLRVVPSPAITHEINATIRANDGSALWATTNVGLSRFRKVFKFWGVTLWALEWPRILYGAESSLGTTTSDGGRVPFRGGDGGGDGGGSGF